jgi:hypothetical protein
MKQLNVKSNKVNREINIPAPAVLNMTGQELIDTLGPETVQAYLIDKVKIATRAKVRSMLEKTDDAFMSDDAIMTSEDWSEFVPQHQERTAPGEKLAKDLAKLDPEALARVLAAAGITSK